MCVFVSDVDHISVLVANCKVHKCVLSVVEYNFACRLDWFLTCPDHACAYYQRNGEKFSAQNAPCIECQTDFIEEAL